MPASQMEIFCNSDMILYLLLVILLLPLNNAEVKIENKRDSVADDEVKFIDDGYIITSEESKRASEIIKYNRMTTYTIEVLVMLDFSIYRWWLNLYGGDSIKTISALHLFYANIFKKIKALYKQVPIRGLRYDLEVVDIQIAKSENEVPFVENKHKISKNEVNIDTVLRNLTSWLKNERKSFPRHDIFAFFTKYEAGLFRGLAWPMSACKDHAVSVTRELGFYDTFHVATHEIGHILGSDHDTSSNCRQEDQYIMAPSFEFNNKTFHNRYRFSTCSLDSFEKYMRQLNDASANCLVIKSAKSYFEMDQFTKVPLGTQFTADRHCQILRGPNSFFCAGGGDEFKTMCREITCWNDIEKICQGGPKSAPADGTPCESGRSCKNEACLPDPNVRKGQENCFYGDWKGSVSKDNKGNDVTCNDVKRDRTYLCYMPEVAKACCETCSKIYQPQERGCEYGDKIYGCKKSECTYDEESRCCKTCKANVSEPCQFGDKASWCPSMERFQCYTNEHTCCKTCKNWLDKTKKNCGYGDKNPYCENEVKEGRPIDCARFKDLCCHTCSNYN